MNRAQKVAWFHLIVIALAAIASVINSLLYMRKLGCSFSQAWWFGTVWPVLISIALIVPSTMLPQFNRKKEKVLVDERDLLIQRRASRFGYAAAATFFVISIIITTIVVGTDKMIPAYWLLRFFLGGWYIITITQATTILVCYKFGLIDGEE